MFWAMISSRRHSTSSAVRLISMAFMSAFPRDRQRFQLQLAVEQVGERAVAPGGRLGGDELEVDAHRLAGGREPGMGPDRSDARLAAARGGGERVLEADPERTKARRVGVGDILGGRDLAG